MTKAVDNQEKFSFFLIRFAYGDLDADPQFQRYTNWTDSIVSGYTAVPTMKVTVPENTGVLDGRSDTRAEINLPSDAFTRRYEGGLGNAAVFVEMIERVVSTFGGESASELHHFNGRVTKVLGNRNGKKGRVGLQAFGRKVRLKTRLGIKATHHCRNQLFGRGCALQRAVFQRTVTIDSVDGRTVTINDTAFTSPTSPGGNVDFYWDRGYLERDGQRIDVQSWSLSDPTKLHLRRRVPDDWVSPNTVIAVPGCHKTREDCEDVWDNIEGQNGEGGFLAPGYNIPFYNPMFESPS